MNKILKRTIIAGVFGHALECYDFTLYASFSAILAMVFFPAEDPRLGLLFTFGVFALSFLVRPFGGVIFGYLGDHFGRKNALIVSIVAMSAPTFLLGVLPSYAAIGIWAPVLLTFLRLTQGIAVSGEMTTAITYLVEHAGDNQRGFVGSLTMCSAIGGAAMSAAVVALITASVSHEQLLSWGWRLPFLLGGLLGLLGLIMRLRSSETLHFQTAKKSLVMHLKPSFAKHFRGLEYQSIFIAVLLMAVMAISYYFLVGYFNAFLIKTMAQPVQSIMLINFVCLLLLTCLAPLLGIVSDKIGRKSVLITSIAALIIFIYPIFWLLQQTIFLIFLGELLFVMILAPIVAIIPTVLSEMFQVHTRNSGAALGYNISQAIFGGTAPLIALQLVASTKNLYAPSWYLIAGAAISLLALLKVKETYEQPLT